MAAAKLGIEPIPTLYADAFASGMPSRAAFETLLAELAARIENAAPVDGVVLTLHGAMAAEGHPDAEATIARQVRAVVGPHVPIAVTLDFHANIGQAMVDAVDIVTTYDTYPHRDEAERAREAVALLARTVRGEIRPTAALVKPPMMPVPQGQFTDAPPFKDLIAAARAMERDDALTVTVAGGFPYADVPVAGSGFLVITDGQPERAQSLATELARQAWAVARGDDGPQYAGRASGHRSDRPASRPRHPRRRRRQHRRRDARRRHGAAGRTPQARGA